MTARLTIDIGAIADNWRALRGRSRPARCGAAVKANAYGLGVTKIVPALRAAGCRDFFAATVEEAVAVKALAPAALAYSLNGVEPDNAALASGAGVIPVLASMNQVETWLAECDRRAIAIPCALQVDTGMNRLGLTVAEALDFAADADRRKRLGVRLVMSHFACADEPGHEMNARQVAAFAPVRAAFAGVESSMANSAGVYLGGDALCDLTRPGIAIYGGESVNDVVNPMRPAVTAEAKILQVRHAPAGETVGYGATHVLGRDSRLAICGIGYADGWPRAGSGSGVAMRDVRPQGLSGFIGGRRVPVVGRISMDLTVFDVTDVPETDSAPGAWVELFGNNISLDDAARAAGTIGYELLTGLGRRYEREYRR